MKMTRALKDKWIEGLRTMPQTTGALHKAVGFCCLGVLQKVRGLEAESDGWSGHYKYDNEGAILGKSTQEEFSCEPTGFDVPATELSSELQVVMFGKLLGKNGSFALTELNDQGATFAQIIPLIEKYVEVTDEAHRAEQA